MTIRSPFWKSTATSANRSVRNSALSARSSFWASTVSPGVIGRYEITVDGSIRSFSNVCRHRMMVLLEGRKRLVQRFGSKRGLLVHNAPSLTIESRWNRPVRIKWINDLVDANGNYLPHLLPVDPTLHWANPPGGPDGRDTAPDWSGMPTPGAYTGPVVLLMGKNSISAAEAISAGVNRDVFHDTRLMLVEKTWDG